ncbi:hypothetical protein [uncultured Serinicoccus sp.]|uniref:hypothetical protein n=1 Tax=uncultured Serinicoccus sp. TaxID=735514 RepID=UPI0026198C0F|nr:hypothetical protein [uncultured Serinicoccus sp.]
MAGDGATVQVFETQDGLLLFGDEDALVQIEDHSLTPVKKISPQQVARVAGYVGVAAGDAMANSGRWVKLTAESAEAVKKAGGVGKVASGVLRGDTGKILQHLKLDPLSAGALATPTASAVLGGLAAQYAIEAALDDITAYLEIIDAKLDKLLKQRKTQTLGQLGGVTAVIDEAASIFEQTGRVSSTTWSKVQSNSLALATMQHEAIAELAALAEEVARSAGDADQAAKVLGEAADDAQFWLGVLARCIALQDRQYVLELARVFDEGPEQVDSHRQGIEIARADRVRRIEQALRDIAASVSESAALSNLSTVVNPLSAPRVARRAGAITTHVATFAQHADLQVAGIEVASTPWRRAARGLFDETSTAVGGAGASAVGRAKGAGQRVGKFRDDRVLRRARKIEEKRGLGADDDQP